MSTFAWTLSPWADTDRTFLMHQMGLFWKMASHMPTQNSSAISGQILLAAHWDDLPAILNITGSIQVPPKDKSFYFALLNLIISCIIFSRYCEFMSVPLNVGEV